MSGDSDNESCHDDVQPTVVVDKQGEQSCPGIDYNMLFKVLNAMQENMNTQNNATVESCG